MEGPSSSITEHVISRNLDQGLDKFHFYLVVNLIMAKKI